LATVLRKVVELATDTIKAAAAAKPAAAAAAATAAATEIAGGGAGKSPSLAAADTEWRCWHSASFTDTKWRCRCSASFAAAHVVPADHA